jgi:hypothetical protein
MSGGQSGARSSASGTGGTRRRCRCPGELHLPVARAPPSPPATPFPSVRYARHAPLTRRRPTCGCRADPPSGCTR